MIASGRIVFRLGWKKLRLNKEYVAWGGIFNTGPSYERGHYSAGKSIEILSSLTATLYLSENFLPLSRLE